MNAASAQPSTINFQLSTERAPRTHPITAGTRNITLNVPESEASFWERLTDQLGFRSRNACLAHFLGLGLRTLSEEKQLEWALIRRRFFNGAACGLLLLVFVGGLVMGSHKDLRRATRRGSRRIETQLLAEVTDGEEKV